MFSQFLMHKTAEIPVQLVWITGAFTLSKLHFRKFPKFSDVGGQRISLESTRQLLG